MSRSLFSTNTSTRLTGSLCILVLTFASVIAQQTGEAKRPALDIEGTKVFAKAILLDNVNSKLDAWAKNGSKYNPEMLDYCLHQLEYFVKSHGYLQAKVTKGNIEQTEAGPRVLLTVVEGTLYRVGKMTVDGARLITSEQILNEIGVKTGDIANGEKLSVGLFERLKVRYAKFGYIQYMAEVVPTFHAGSGDGEGVVDFALTIDEGEQYTVRSMKIEGADKALTDMLRRELVLRAGDIYDNELFRESITRMNRTGLVEPIDAEKDVDYLDLQEKQRQLAFKNRLDNPDVGPPLVEMVIRVKKAGSTVAIRER